MEREVSCKSNETRFSKFGRPNILLSTLSWTKPNIKRYPDSLLPNWTFILFHVIFYFQLGVYALLDFDEQLHTKKRV